ncbi:phage tail protein [Pseudomonas sp. CAM1A]|uniref:phage tail protein n=1 Tax=Pseudomonas sp. CAM1A TaxID=3231717 RepID=UPI0039C5C2BC
MKFSISTGCFYSSRIHKDIPPDAIEVADDEYQLLVAGRNSGQEIKLEDGQLTLEYTEEFKEARERGWRVNTLLGIQWIRDRHRDQVDLGVTPTLTSEQFNELLAYLQALRDWPQSEHFPEVERRPAAPPWIAEQTQ